MKFGGTSVANLNRIKNLYKLIKKKIKNQEKKLLWLCLHSGVTNNLIKEFKKVDLEISNPEYDVILSTGEQFAAYISAFLNKNGIKSRSIFWVGKFLFRLITNTVKLELNT